MTRLLIKHGLPTLATQADETGITEVTEPKRGNTVEEEQGGDIAPKIRVATSPVENTLEIIKHTMSLSIAIMVPQAPWVQAAIPYQKPNISLPGHDTLIKGAKQADKSQTLYKCKPLQISDASVMGTPVRSGYDSQQGYIENQLSVSDQADGANHRPQQSHGTNHPYARSMSSSQRRDLPKIYPGHGGQGQNQGHGVLLGRGANLQRKTGVAPAVPSFGTPIFTNNSFGEPQGKSEKVRKSVGKYNELGLTPTAEQHESSEEEEETHEEETSLGAAVDGSRSQSVQLQITYKGKTLHLKSASDIAIWIEDRKKMFPRKARAAKATEQNATGHEVRKAAMQGRRRAQEKQKAEAEDRQRERQQWNDKVRKGPEDVAAKAKRKVEKLRKQLEKEERRVAKAEIRAGRSNIANVRDEEAQPSSRSTDGQGKKRKRSESTDDPPAAAIIQEKSEFLGECDAMLPALTANDTLMRQEALDISDQKQQKGFVPLPGPSISTVQPCSSKDEMQPFSPLSEDDKGTRDVPEIPQPRIGALSTRPSIASDERLADSTTDLSSTDSDLTSSSGSSSSDGDSDNDGPESSTTKRIEPEKKILSKRARANQVCRAFLRTGRCRLGARCRDRHELPERANHSSKAKNKGYGEYERRKGRIGLYQRNPLRSRRKFLHLIGGRRDHFEQAIATLEHAQYALAFSSGSATTATILQSLPQGSHVISVSDVYGGTHRYFTRVAAAHGVQVTFSPSIELDVAEMIRPGETKLVWIESPSNPTLSLVDISKDVLMGCAAFNSPSLKERLTFLQNAIGAVPSPFDCWLAHRGLKTLHLRAREASHNALVVANALAASPNTLLVNYPGLPTNKQHAICLKQHRNGLGGGMLSFRIKGGLEAAERFCQNTSIFTLAESLGGVESLVEVPSSMTHAGIPKEQRESAGVWDDLVRVSCGVEDAEDLKRDVLQALEKAVVGPKVRGTLNVIEKGEVNGHA
ncbi:MAG: hypothetical protein Q9163_004369 [Psora crenata]